jgi:hypothetical protein
MAPALARATLLELAREAPAEVRRQMPAWVGKHAKLSALLDVIEINCDEAHADRLSILERLHDAEARLALGS